MSNEQVNLDFGRVVFEKEDRGLRVTEIKLNDNVRGSLSTTTKRLAKASGRAGQGQASK